MTSALWCLAAAAGVWATLPSAAARLGGTQSSAPGGRGPLRAAPAVLAGVFAVTLVSLWVGRATVVVAGVLVAATAWWVIRDVRRNRTRRTEREVLAAFLGTVTGDLRAGATLPTAWARGAEALPAGGPPGLRDVLVSAGVVAARGGSLPQVLQASPQLRGLAQLCALSDDYGIPLARLMESAQARFDAARRHAQATQASLQGPQATAYVLTCLPLAGIAMGVVMGADPVGFLFGGGLGGALLVLGVLLACAGFAWSRYIIGKAAG